MYSHTSSSVQFESGNTRIDSPRRLRALYSRHSSGRWLFGSHLCCADRNENTRSFARERSSSRRAPPNAASKPYFVTACLRLSVFITSVYAADPWVNGVMPISTPSVLTCTSISRPCSAAIRERNSYISRNFHVVSMCRNGNGGLPGWNAFSASRSITELSLPIEYSITGRSACATTSRMIWMLSASKRWRWVSRIGSARRPSMPCRSSRRRDRWSVLRAPLLKRQQRPVDDPLTEFLAVVEMRERRVRHRQLHELAKRLPAVAHRPHEQPIGGNVLLYLLVEALHRAPHRLGGRV